MGLMNQNLFFSPIFISAIKKTYRSPVCLNLRKIKTEQNIFYMNDSIKKMARLVDKI